MMLLDKIKQEQKQFKSGPKNALDIVANELDGDNRKEYLEAISNAEYSATVIAEVIINENISETANRLGKQRLSKAIQRYRRGETTMEVTS
jgi:hypothetical protein